MYIRDSHDENLIFSCWKCGCKHAPIFGIQCIFETSQWGHERGICYVYCIICTYLEIKTTSLLRSLHSNNRVSQSLKTKSKSIPIPIQVWNHQKSPVVVPNPLRSYSFNPPKNFPQSIFIFKHSIFLGIHYHESRPAHISRLDSSSICFRWLLPITRCAKHLWKIASNQIQRSWCHHCQGGSSQTSLRNSFPNFPIQFGLNHRTKQAVFDKDLFKTSYLFLVAVRFLWCWGVLWLGFVIPLADVNMVLHLQDY